MKNLQIIIVLFISTVVYSQKTCNVNSDGIAVKGYDVVSYFTGNVKKGKEKYTFSYDNIKYRFYSLDNLTIFKENPLKYIPQYGGWCAYAMAVKGEKVDMDPKTFEIRDGKLYLFYKNFFTNTYTSWLEENPELLKKDADNNWKKIEIK